MTPERLPPDTLVDWESSGPTCPWCQGDIGAAAVTIEALLCAHGHNQLQWPKRAPDGQADPCAVVVDCPGCGRPSAVAVRTHHGFPVMRLLAVRTAADARLLAGEGSAPLADGPSDGEGGT